MQVFLLVLSDLIYLFARRDNSLLFCRLIASEGGGVDPKTYFTYGGWEGEAGTGGVGRYFKVQEVTMVSGGYPHL